MKKLALVLLSVIAMSCSGDDVDSIREKSFSEANKGYLITARAGFNITLDGKTISMEVDNIENVRTKVVSESRSELELTVTWDKRWVDPYGELPDEVYTFESYFNFRQSNVLEVGAAPRGQVAWAHYTGNGSSGISNFRSIEK